MVSIERREPGTHGDVNPDLRAAYSPASSLSPSPLTPTAEGETSVGKRTDRVVENSEFALRCVHLPPSQPPSVSNRRVLNLLGPHLLV